PLTASHPPVLSTLSLHDALPISRAPGDGPDRRARRPGGLHPAAHPAGHLPLGPDDRAPRRGGLPGSPAVRRAHATCTGCAPTCPDRKSTRLNSSHVSISYAVFCL